jgi:hypothetical protein
VGSMNLQIFLVFFGFELSMHERDWKRRHWFDLYNLLASTSSEQRTPFSLLLTKS